MSPINETPEDGAALVGRPFTVPIELGKVREFARATKARSRSYFTEEHPATPPTFLATMLFWAEKEDLPYNRQGFRSDRVLHGGREYVFHGPPPRAGQKLVAQQRIDNTYTKTGRRGGEMRFVVAVTEFRDETGALVVEMWNTTIETSRPAVSEDPA